jgi:hypothetical protein
VKSEDAVRGMTITNGMSAMELTEHVTRNPKWKTSGWNGKAIGLERFNGMPGGLDFIPDYLLGSWRPVPWDWTPVIGGGLEERYVRTANYFRLHREVRRCEA